MRVRFAPKALEQISTADKWWRRNRREAPDLLMTELDAALALIAAAPDVGVAYAHARVRIWLAGFGAHAGQARTLTVRDAAT